MLVFVVVATLPDNSAMDVDRMNKVEDIPDDLARAMLNAGTARQPTEAELAEYRGEHPEADEDKPVDGPRPYVDDTPLEQFDNGGDLQPGLAQEKNATAKPVQVESAPKRPRGGEQTAGTVEAQPAE